MLSERLSLLRKEKKLTQKELSQKLKMARTTYSGYENGSREPDNETLNKFAEFYNVSTDYLLGRTDIKEGDLGDSPSIYKADYTEYVIKEMVNKYKIDLSDPHKKEVLEKMIRIVAED
ncbi:helix-turn-helix transcriptional regulator [Paenibacillus sp. FSL M7-0896]|uniref:helix-turn-helix domain-containing protein n=1 Tax=Paenibacillus sp. FSL M7-0896 TaxID=2921610 RepID=UPI0030DA1430